MHALYARGLLRNHGPLIILLKQKYRDILVASAELNREVGLTRNDNAAHALDEAIAYWIGTSQDGGRTRGHSLYALAQRAGELFGTNIHGGEAKVNTEIIEL